MKVWYFIHFGVTHHIGPIAYKLLLFHGACVHPDFLCLFAREMCRLYFWSICFTSLCSHCDQLIISPLEILYLHHITGYDTLWSLKPWYIWAGLNCYIWVLSSHIFLLLIPLLNLSNKLTFEIHVCIRWLLI